MPLFVRRTCFVPTWRGWLMLGALLSLLLVFAGRGLYPFLAPRDEGGSAIWVVEGWMSDFGLRQVAADPMAREAAAVFVIGGALDKGSELIAYRTHARVGALTLVRLGLNPGRVYVVDSPKTERNRTLASMRALRACLESRQLTAGDLMLASPGPHARRSRMLLARVLPGEWNVKVRALGEATYDERGWWRSSEGFRAVIGELLAYLHALVVANPASTTIDSLPIEAPPACTAVAP